MEDFLQNHRSFYIADFMPGVEKQKIPSNLYTYLIFCLLVFLRNNQNIAHEVAKIPTGTSMPF